jgi:hypothetical protein
VKNERCFALHYNGQYPNSILTLNLITIRTDYIIHYYTAARTHLGNCLAHLITLAIIAHICIDLNGLRFMYVVCVNSRNIAKRSII